MFSKQGKTISLIDIKNPEDKKETLDPWFGMALQLADGQHTVDQLIQYVSTQYNGAPPENLSDTIQSVIERLVQSKLIVLTEKAIQLPYYLSLPYELLDIEKVKQEIALDKSTLN